MKKHIMGFCRRGFAACGLGPIVLAIFYLILQYQGIINTLTVNQICIGIFSLTTLAFFAGALSELYQIERLPLMLAIFIHGTVLYTAYLITYLINYWIEFSTLPILIFTIIFIVGYLIIWFIIYSVIKKNTEKINKILNEKQN